MRFQRGLEKNLEINSINFISENERSGSPQSLFWPWAAGNVSLLALSYGAFFLGFGISFYQATIAAFVGTVGSFFLVGLSSLAGKRANAPTMTLSRAAFGVQGNKLPAGLSYLVFVGWETVLVTLATLATQTVLGKVAHINSTLSGVIGLTFAAGLTMFGGILGYSVIMKIQKWLTGATIFLTLGYITLTWSHINWHAIRTLPSGNTQALVGATIFAITGIGLGWVNSAADYSRYLPRHASHRGVVGWTVFGASIVPIVLVIFGALLAGSSKSLNDSIAADPIGALTLILPTWFLIPFAFVAIFGLVGGSILDLYSSGLALVSLGLPLRRHIAAAIDGAIMTLGTIYIVWIKKDFFGPFQGFLITLGVPVAAWSAIFVADIVMRKSDYSESELFDEKGRYGKIKWPPIVIMIVATFVGFGFVTNTFASWLSWQGYFMSVIGDSWKYSNIGIIFALAIGFFGHLIFGRKTVKVQESIDG